MRYLSFIIRGIIFMIFFSSSLYQFSFAQKVLVSNVKFTVVDENIIIKYDLSGKSDKTYKVDVFLRRQQQSSFQFHPRALSGNIGEGKFAGKEREIVWNYLKDFTPDNSVDDYYFEVTAKTMNKKWIIYTGAAVLVGSVSSLLLFSGKDSPAEEFQFPGRP